MRLQTHKIGAVVLARYNYGEADLILKFLTREYGLLTAMAKHGRKSIKRFGGGLLYPGSAAWFDFTIKPQRDLAFVEKGEFNPKAPVLPDKPIIRALASWALEIVRVFETANSPAHNIFELLIKHLSALSKCQNMLQARRCSLLFTYKYMQLAGFKANLYACQNCGYDIFSLKKENINHWWVPASGGYYCGKCCDAPPKESLSHKLNFDLINHFKKAEECQVNFIPKESDIVAGELFFEKLAEYHSGQKFYSLKVLRRLI